VEDTFIITKTKHYKLDASAIRTWEDLQRLIEALDVRFTDTFPRLEDIRDMVVEIDEPTPLQIISPSDLETPTED